VQTANGVVSPAFLPSSDTQSNLFSPGPQFPSSPDLSKQLQEVLNEKIRSIQSSRNQLYEFGDLELSPYHRVSSTGNLSNASNQLYSPPVERTSHSHTLPRQYSPGTRPIRVYTPRPSDHQLSLLSPTGSRKINPVNVARYSENQASPLSERRRSSRRSSEQSDLAEPISLGISDQQFRDLSLSESDPVYSPPSRSSITDGRYSVVFSPPSEANFSFSLPTDKKYGATFSPPTVSESSGGRSPHETITPSRQEGASPPSEGEVATPPPTRDKRYYTVIQAGTPTYTDSHPLANPVPPAPTSPPPPSSARDKRLSYFLAIEQGESKGT